MLTPTNTPIADAELAELDRMYAAATPGALQARGFRLSHTANRRIDFNVEHIDEIGQIGTGPYQAIPFARREDAEWHAALHNAYPALRQRLTDAESRLAEAEREIEFLRSAGEAEVNFWVNVIRSLDMENLCDFFDGEGAKEELQRWLAARDAQQRRDGAAEWLEKLIAAKRDERPWETFVPLQTLEQAAQRLREGK